MMTITIIADVTLTASKATCEAYLAEVREAEERARWIAEEREIDRKLREWLRTASPEDPEYSDIYKEVYGVRPRW